MSFLALMRTVHRPLRARLHLCYAVLGPWPRRGAVAAALVAAHTHVRDGQHHAGSREYRVNSCNGGLFT